MERNGRPVRPYLLKIGNKYSIVEKTDEEIIAEGLTSFLVDVPRETRAEAEELKRLYESGRF